MRSEKFVYFWQLKIYLRQLQPYINIIHIYIYTTGGCFVHPLLRSKKNFKIDKSFFKLIDFLEWKFFHDLTLVYWQLIYIVFSITLQFYQFICNLISLWFIGLFFHSFIYSHVIFIYPFIYALFVWFIRAFVQ